ncbi:aldehyde dehydrogenase family protein [[Mycobacterium] vasticus]|uniref:aldehyde dehydrogenase (NAD(+)) n=1 Tax=[Mycobacterium] vasticus TaxID=2875777 RepID=A0ABU5Z670_9MYCO|nr:aldehyde dehydrogenase family protein [Mycolicibacter sp. MYC017]MEB3071719.1 aldehyde dehydrogenase family protein [Mycolicibacter sp. MYC017]
MTDLLREPALYIDGDWVPGTAEDCEVENPATEQTTGVVAQASPHEVEGALEAAHRAFASWSATPVAERADALRRLHDVIAERAETFAELINREQGSPPPLARKLHVDVPLSVIAQTAAAVEEFAFRSRIGNSVIIREPVGVVAAITPWNLPLHQIIVKVVPALAAGCTVVLKPAALTPLTAFELARAFDAAGFPAGVFNLVAGSGRDVGEQLTKSPLVDHVSFTGSTAVGRRIAAMAAETLKGVTLELGGKSASVVLSDVSDERLATAVKVTVANCYLNGGQTCTALSRLIVPANRLPQVEQLAAAAAAKFQPGTRLGPLISAGQRKEVESFLTPGKVVSSPLELPDRGYYVTPTVYSDVDPDSRLAQEEIFGPVLSIMTAESDDHAIELANNSIYGLGGALWTDDTDRATEWSARIRTGQVDVNGAPFNPRAPFGGYKQSGIGREIGDYGIADVLEIKAVQL